MACKVDLFRSLACGLEEAVEGEHCGHADFRVGGRIFATLSAQERGCGVLKLTREQQAAFVTELPEVFRPVEGGWGRMGMTYIVLACADEATMRGGLVTAHRNIAMKAARSGAKKAAKSPRSRGLK